MQSSVGYPAVRSYLRVSFSGLVAARRVGVISVLDGTASLPESGACARRARFPLPFLRSSSAPPRTIELLLKREESNQDRHVLRLIDALPVGATGACVGHGGIVGQSDYFLWSIRLSAAVNNPHVRIKSIPENSTTHWHQNTAVRGYLNR